MPRCLATCHPPSQRPQHPRLQQQRPVLQQHHRQRAPPAAAGWYEGTALAGRAPAAVLACDSTIGQGRHLQHRFPVFEPQSSNARDAIINSLRAVFQQRRGSALQGQRSVAGTPMVTRGRASEAPSGPSVQCALHLWCWELPSDGTAAAGRAGWILSCREAIFP